MFGVETVNQYKKIINLVFVVNLVFLIINFLFYKISFLVFFGFLLCLILAGIYWGTLYQRLLSLRIFTSLVFGYLTLFYLLSFTISIFVNFYKYDELFSLLSVVVLGVISYLIGFKYNWLDDLPESKTAELVIRPPFYLVVALPLLLFVSLVLLFLSRSEEYLITPWQVIPKIYIYLFLLITFTVSSLLFSRLKTGVVIFLIIIHSYFLHAYLPLVYETGFGGDKWRHLASEKFLAAGEIYSPSLIGEPIKMVTLGPISLPEVLVAGNKTSYGNQWGLTLLLSEFLSIDIFWIDYWLIFGLWSFFVPLLLYHLSGLIYNKKQFRLLVSFLPTLFYTLQVFGAITIPVSLGAIYFLLILYLWFYYLRYQERRVRNLAIILTLFSYLGYVLYFILLLVIGLGCLLIGEIKKIKIQRFLLILFIAGSCLVIPALESLMGYGSLKAEVFSSPQGIIYQTAEAFGTLTGVVAFIPRPTHIDQGNWLYNQTRQTQSQASLFGLRILPFFFTGLVWLLALLGIQKIRKLDNKKIAWFILVALGIMIFSYVFSWYFMTGNHILARRLDVTITFFWLILVALGIFYLLENVFTKVDEFTKVYAIAVMLAVVAASTYSSGPVLEVVTKDEVSAAEYVWEKIDKNSPYCVVANTWPLLGLEYVSGRKIIAGGFPVYLEYAQPERVKIFEGLIRKPKTDDWLKKAFEVTKSSECWYLTEKRWMSDKVWEENLEIFGPPQAQVGKVFIWQIKAGE